MKIYYNVLEACISIGWHMATFSVFFILSHEDIHKEDFQYCSERAKSDGISMLETRRDTGCGGACL